jgi:hypothetical protein
MTASRDTVFAHVTRSLLALSFAGTSACSTHGAAPAPARNLEFGEPLANGAPVEDASAGDGITTTGPTIGVPMDAGFEASMSAPGSEAGPPGSFGQPCGANSDCAAGFCLETHVCSKPCRAAGDCPPAPEWLCADVPSIGSVCTCTPSSSGPVCGGGRDHDCNGVVDPENLDGGLASCAQASLLACWSTASGSLFISLLGGRAPIAGMVIPFAIVDGGPAVTVQPSTLTFVAGALGLDSVTATASDDGGSLAGAVLSVGPVQSPDPDFNGMTVTVPLGSDAGYCP